MDIALPPRDGAVARALGDLETRLAAWTDAVRAVQERFSAKAAELDKTAQAMRKSAVAEGTTDVQSETAFVEAERPVADASGSTSALQTHARDSIAGGDSGSDVDANDKLEKAITANSVAEPRQDEIMASESGGDCLDEDEALLQSLEPETAEAIRARYETCGGRQSVRELIQAYEDDVDDEESLLLALDEEVAKTIRVQYRLFNGRKTIRELIDEHEANASVQPERTSWGKKVKG